RALAVENDERLIGVVAVHGVFLPRLVVVHPSVEARCVKDVFAPFFLVRHIDEIDDFDAHCKFLLVFVVTELRSLRSETSYRRAVRLWSRGARGGRARRGTS